MTSSCQALSLCMYLYVSVRRTLEGMLWCYNTDAANKGPLSQTVDVLKSQIKWKYMCTGLDFDYPNMLHYCTCHNILDIVACVKFWSDHMSIFRATVTYISKYLRCGLINRLWNRPRMAPHANKPHGEFIAVAQQLFLFCVSSFGWLV